MSFESSMYSPFHKTLPEVKNVRLNTDWDIKQFLSLFSEYLEHH